MTWTLTLGIWILISLGIWVLVIWAVGRTIDRTVSNPIEALDAIVEHIFGP